ncbi:hypothetical protein K1T71_009544 [Dendrolimus kikuchii]|uniref:Uncharacterized protein n=1 Tax=Dendrolimus kikuchii TaxID=765133 RepID=A0ACC1CS05_9NEOP|nr:hypothetical protein K1T71_009544 [Dendrolimus kikuchii]
MSWLLFLVCVSGTVMCYPYFFETKKFRVGIEYDHSLPMTGGSDRYRHRNNYDPFFVTVTAAVKRGYVISYLEVSATVDALGEVDFNLIRGQTGSTSMVFQLVSNHSDFLSYNYLAYGIREEEYRKMSNIVTLPLTNAGSRNDNAITFIAFILLYTCYILYP